MTYKNPQPELFAFLESYADIAIVGHEEPDGDCIGSQLALAHFLKSLGKRITLCSAGPFNRPEIQDSEAQFLKSVPQDSKAVIVVDCSTIQRIGTVAESTRGKPTLVIDHHTAGAPFGDISYIDTAAPSVTFMIQRIIETQRIPQLYEAEWLLFGLCTDTGFFRHLDNNTHEVFQSVSRLVDAGASTKKVFRQINGNRTLHSRRLLGKLLERSEQWLDGRVLFTYETHADRDEFGTHHRDSDSLYQHLQMVNGCKAVVFIREEKTGVCSVGLRSYDDIDVGQIAKKFGGGGHKQAAGFAKPGSFQEVRDQLLSYLENQIPQL